MRKREKKEKEKASFSHATKVAVEETVRKIAYEMGYECVFAGFVRENESLILRVLLDSLGGINIGDCERVSKKISRTLDELFDDLLTENYFLEVGSK